MPAEMPCHACVFERENTRHACVFKSCSFKRSCRLPTAPTTHFTQRRAHSHKPTPIDSQHAGMADRRNLSDSELEALMQKKPRWGRPWQLRRACCR
jgi:hypothetical protein